MNYGQVLFLIGALFNLGSAIFNLILAYRNLRAAEKNEELFSLLSDRSSR